MTESLPPAQPSSRVKEQNRPSESQRDKEQPPSRKPSKSPLTKHENNPQLEYRVGNNPNRKSRSRDFKRASGLIAKRQHDRRSTFTIGSRIRPPTYNRCRSQLIDSPRIVQLELYDFGFEMQESSDFEIPDFLIPDSRFPLMSERTLVIFKLPESRSIQSSSVPAHRLLRLHFVCCIRWSFSDITTSAMKSSASPTCAAIPSSLRHGPASRRMRN